MKKIPKNPLQNFPEIHEFQPALGSTALIAAMTTDRVIGHTGQLPRQNSPEFRDFQKTDLGRFRALTTGHRVVMGRATRDSLPTTFRPLPARQNLVLSRSLDPAQFSREFPEAQLFSDPSQIPPDPTKILRVIGGQKIYEHFLPHADTLILTILKVSLPGDTVFPEIPTDFSLVHERDFPDHSLQLRQKSPKI